MRCTTCKSAFTDSVILPDSLSAEGPSNIGVCKPCISHCNSCPDEDNCNAGGCASGYVNTTSNNGYSICSEVTSDCATAADDGTTDCTTCDDSYFENAGECGEYILHINVKYKIYTTNKTQLYQEIITELYKQNPFI